MGDSFEVEANVDYEGIDYPQIAEEELDKASVRTTNTWQEKMAEAGYKNTGDTINSITWESPAQFERVIGSDRMAALVGEFGRRPGAGHPPPDAIADWVHDQAGLPNRGETAEWDFGDGPETVTFDTVVFLIGKGINENGLPAHNFGQKALREEGPRLEEGLAERLQEAADDQSI